MPGRYVRCWVPAQEVGLGMHLKDYGIDCIPTPNQIPRQRLESKYSRSLLYKTNRLFYEKYSVETILFET